jgi:hypothetical protein
MVRWFHWLNIFAKKRNICEKYKWDGNLVLVSSLFTLQLSPHNIHFPTWYAPAFPVQDEGMD